MAGEEKTYGLELLAQAIGRHPRCCSFERNGRWAIRPAGEEIVLTFAACFERACARFHDAIDIGEGGGAIDAEFIESAGGGQRLQCALVDDTRIGAAGEIGNVTEETVRFPLRAEMLDSLLTDILERCERIANRANRGK